MPTIDGQRVVADLKRLAEFGRYKTGVHRPTYSPVDVESRRWLADKFREAGLETVIDGIGNVIGRYPGARRRLLVGSHSETQPYGGWLDGSLGVIYGLELARALGTGPRIILLDEVLAGLTGAEVAAALDLIRVLHERHALTILIIEHVMRALMRLSDRIVVLHHGCKIADDLPARIAEHPAVLDAYLGTGRNVDDAA